MLTPATERTPFVDSLRQSLLRARCIAGRRVLGFLRQLERPVSFRCRCCNRLRHSPRACPFVGNAGDARKHAHDATWLECRGNVPVPAVAPAVSISPVRSVDVSCARTLAASPMACSRVSPGCTGPASTPCSKVLLRRSRVRRPPLRTSSPRVTAPALRSCPCSALARRLLAVSDAQPTAHGALPGPQPGRRVDRASVRG